MTGKMKIVLAYSGGLDTSVIIPWLKEHYDADIITYTADLGQNEDLDAVRQKALYSGAVKAYVEDLRREFVEEYVFPTLRAGAVYEGEYLLGTAMARPLIAKHLAAVAEKEGATAVAHGATGKGNDQVRFELGVRAINPDLRIIAPWREWELRSREDEIDYAAAHGIPVPATKENPYSIDRNLWHTSHEGGVLEDPSRPAPEEVFTELTPPVLAPDAPEDVIIEWESGTPVAVNGEHLEPVALVEHLNALAGRHGVGVLDMVEDRLVGMKSRGVYQTPAGTVLHFAHRNLEHLTLDRATQSFKNIVAARYAELVYDGLWFSPLRSALQSFVDATQKTVTGWTRVRLYKGQVLYAGAGSPYSLYSPALATFGADDVYDHKDAAGFIRLFGLPLEVQARVAQATVTLAGGRTK